MNRKQVLKDLKKRKKEVNNKEVEDNNYITRFLGLLGALLVLIVICYLFIGIFINKTITFGNNNNDEDTDNIVNIDNSTILAGQLFNQKDENYYVLVYDVNEKNSLLKDWINFYSTKEEKLPIYYVDSKIDFNKNYIVTSDSNTSPSGYEDLKIKAPTLIRISNGMVEEYIEEVDRIIEVLKN